MPDALRTGPPCHLFVYGTLRRGGSNDVTRWLPAPAFVGDAFVQGTLYDFGAYPGLRLEGQASVAGEVYRIDPTLEPALDRLEGIREDDSGEYVRRLLDVTVQQQVRRCLLYEIQMERIVDARGIIEEADWLAHLRRLAGDPAPAAGTAGAAPTGQGG